MYRKITRTGPATLTISLPAKWVKKHNLKPSEYVELKEAENKLIITSKPGEKSENITIQYNEVLIENMLEKLFLEAESTITIESRTRIPKTIINTINQFPGFEITELWEKKVIINRVMSPSLNKPSALLRRIYQVLIDALKQNPANFSSDVSENIFLLQLVQERPKEIFLLREFYETILKIKTPAHDDAYALVRVLFNKIYMQKYNFSTQDSKKISEIFSKTDDLFKGYYQKTKSHLQISQLYYCVQLLNQLHKEIIYSQSIDALSDITDKKEKKYRIGVCLKNQANVFWDQEIKGSIIEVSKNYPEIEIILDSPLIDMDAKTQDKILQRFIEQKVDGIIFAPGYPKIISKTIDKINKENIPLVILDTDLETNQEYIYIGFDNYQGGYLTGEYLKKKLKPKSKILTLKGYTTGNSVRRVDGFEDAIGKGHKIDMIQAHFQESEAYEKTLKYLQKNEVDAIFATSDNMAMGVIKAVEELNKKVLIAGFDWTEEGKEALKQGKIISDISSKPRELGELGVQTIHDILKGKTIAERIEYKVELIKAEKTRK